MSVWLGASLSVSSVFLGSSVSAAGTAGGIAAILTGSLSGCCFLFLATLAGSLSCCAIRRRPALPDDSRREKISSAEPCLFHPDLRFLPFLSSVLLIVQAALAARSSLLIFTAALISDSSVRVPYSSVLLPLPAYLFFALVVCATALCCFPPPKPAAACRRIIIFCSAAASLFLCGALLFCAGRFSASQIPANLPSGFRLSFAEATGLSASAPLLWIPAFLLFFHPARDADHGEIRRAIRQAGAGSALFFAGSCFLQFTGFFFVRHAGITGLSETLSFPPLRVFWIAFSALSAAVAVWFCIFSAAKSSVTIYCSRISEKTASAVLLSAVAAAALLLRTEQLESASELFSAFVLPLLGVYIAVPAADFFFRKIAEYFPDPEEKSDEMTLCGKISGVRNGDVLSVLLCASGFFILECAGYRTGAPEKALILFPFFTLFCTAARIAFLCSQEECTSLRKNIKTYLKKRNQEKKKHHENRSVPRPALRRNRQKQSERQNAAPGSGRSRPRRRHDDSAAGKDPE